MKVISVKERRCCHFCGLFARFGLVDDKGLISYVCDNCKSLALRKFS